MKTISKKLEKVWNKWWKIYKRLKLSKETLKNIKIKNKSEKFAENRSV